MNFFKQRLAIAIISASITGLACAESDQVGSDTMDSGVNQSSEAATPAFNDLDKDQDGFISAVEATNDSTLMDKWSKTDTNADRKIDRSEFSKFEMKEDQSGAEMPADEGVSQGMQEAVEQPEQKLQQQQEGAKPQY